MHDVSLWLTAHARLRAIELQSYSLTHTYITSGSELSRGLGFELRDLVDRITDRQTGLSLTLCMQINKINIFTYQRLVHLVEAPRSS